MKSTISLILALAFIAGPIATAAKAKLVACVGSSTTYGAGLPDRESNCYPAQLAKILQAFDSEWETRNFGVNGACVLRKGSLPYVTLGAFSSARACEPDVVVIQLGVNDSVPGNWVHKDDFIPDFLALIDGFEQLPNQPEIYIWLPKPVFSSPWGHSNSVIRDEIIPLIRQLPTYRDVQLIDLYTPLEHSRHLFQPDGVHLTVEGTQLAAEIVGATIIGMRGLPDFNGDSKVDIADLVILIESWGEDEPLLDVAPPPFGDGTVDAIDLAAMMEYWGQELNDTGLAAYWALDETEGFVAYDSAGDNDGTVMGVPVWHPRAGKIDGALELAGTTFVTANFVLSPSEGPFSVLAWVKGGAPGQVIVSQADAKVGRLNYPGCSWLGIDAVGALTTDLAGSESALAASEVVITDDQWHRVALVWGRSWRTSTLYVDGVEIAAHVNPTRPTTYGGLQIGVGRSAEPNTFFTGLIDDVRIYNRAVRP
jgi:lysophospholipase L1-like esterase